MGKKPVAAGASSIDLVDAEKLFQILNLKKGMTIIDLACGWGYYSFEMSRYAGDDGHVYAVDLWQEGIRFIEEQIEERSIKNITPILADVSRNIPLEDECVDLCLMATVLHDLIEDHTDQGTLKEIRRVMKKEGVLALIEFKVMDGPPGPPKKIRISPEDAEKILLPYGFSRESSIDIGDFVYLSVFRKAGL